MSRKRYGVLWAAVIAALAAVRPLPVAAQQEPVRLEPRGFDFTPNGGWRARARRVAAQRAAALARGDFRSLNAALTSRANLMAPGTPVANAMAVTGVLRVPVILFRFLDTSPATTADSSQYSAALFGTTPPVGRPYTVRTFYEEMSNGLFSMQGTISGWVTLDSGMARYTGSATACSNPFPGASYCNGIWNASAINAMQAGLREAVTKVDGSVNFGLFDNDGPDGLPNSGDDDGFVDIAVFVHAARDGACGGSNNLWSHRYTLGSFATNDSWTGHTGQAIRISNYTLQSGVGGVTACDDTQLMAPGTAAHETGHGLGLPDFYDTNPNDGDAGEGIGHWGLMGSGNYAKPMSPAYMEGFSRLQLGWVAVRDLSAGGSYGVGAYTVGDTVFRITPATANPRGEYFLIENRQATDGDTALVNSKGPGLLVWHVDPVQYANGQFSNTVNSGPVHALSLLQADGLDQLGSSTPGFKNRGDAGDPFPGTSGATVLGQTTNPAVVLNGGGVAPFVIDSIRQVVAGGAMAFRFTTGSLAVVDTALRAAVMGVAYADTLLVMGGTGPASYALLSGTLPSGLILSTGGALSGTATQAHRFTFVIRASSGLLAVDLPLALDVAAPTLALVSVVDQMLLGGNHLTTPERNYLDQAGNNNGQLDVGDFTAWLDRTGNAVDARTMGRILARGR